MGSVKKPVLRRECQETGFSVRFGARGSYNSKTPRGVNHYRLKAVALIATESRLKRVARRSEIGPRRWDRALM